MESSFPPHCCFSAASQLEAKKSLLDAELEKMLHQKQSIEAMEKVGHSLVSAIYNICTLMVSAYIVEWEIFI